MDKSNIIPILFSLVLSISCFGQETKPTQFEQWDSLLTMHYYAGQFEEAIVYAQQIIDLATTQKVDTILVVGTYSIAALYSQIGDYEKAEKYYIQTIEIQKRNKPNDYGDLATYINDLAAFYQNWGRYKEAKDYYLESLNLRKTHLGVSSTDYASSLSNFGTLLFYMGDYLEAEKMQLKSLKVYLALYGKEHPDYLSTQNNLAALYNHLGRYEEAENAYLQIISVYKKNGLEEEAQYAVFINNLADIYRKLNRYEEAEPLQKKALEIYQKIYGLDIPEIALLMNNLAALYENMEDYDKAESYYLESLRIRTKLFDKSNPIIAQSLNNLAKLYQLTERHTEAQTLLLQVLKIRKQALGEEHDLYAIALTNLGAFYQETQNYEKAELYYLQAQAVFLKTLGDKSPNYVSSLYTLAELYRLTNRTKEAAEMASRSLVANLKQGFSLKDVATQNYQSSPFITPLQAVASYLSLAYSKRELFNENKDIKLLQEQFELLNTLSILIQKLQIELPSKKDKLRLLEDATIVAEVAIKTAFMLFELTKEKSYLETTITFAEFNKSILLSTTLQSEQALHFGEVPDSLLLQERTLKNSFSTLEKELAQSKTQKDSIKIQHELLEANLKKNALLKILKENYPKYNELNYQVNSLSVASIQKELIDSKTALLEYFVQGNSMFLIVVTQKSITVYPINFEKGALDKSIKTLRQTLSNYKYIIDNPKEAYTYYTETASYLYQKLVAPAQPNLEGINKLIIVADGNLGHIPFEVLLTKTGQKTTKIDYKQLHYLLNDFAISYSYSTSLLLESTKKVKLQNNGKLLVMGATYPPLDSSILAKRSFLHHKIRTELQPLKAVEAEVLNLKKQFPSGSFYFGLESNEALFKETAKDFSVVHLAMHGILNKKNPLISSLAFTENGDSLQDNFLEVHEISALQLNSDLVVLSACETGYGKFEQGEGVLSLARSFMYAGVPSLVVSLWQVNDYATSKIMMDFYSNLQDGMDKSVALRQAKLNYINSATDISVHPAFWSPFIQLGDSSPIVFKKEFSWFWICGFGGAVLFLLIIIVIKKTKK